MNRRLLGATSCLFLLLAGACSSATTSSTTPAGTTPPGTEGTGGTTDGTENGGAAATGPFKTYVILGDSISDQGGSGPFFYDLVGKDLKAKGEVAVVKKSKGGAVSAQLATQVKALPTTLAGPVAVSVTIGGNDMQNAAINILQGNDAKERTAFAANLKKAYDELTTAGRFGEGVKVTIFHATIYDPSDGKGNFAEAGCPGYLSQLPKQPTTGFWDNWNKSAADAIAPYGDAVVTVDIRSQFQGHGVDHFKDGTSWYDSDCIHPNTTGHAELSKMFFKAISPESN